MGTSMPRSSGCRRSLRRFAALFAALLAIPAAALVAGPGVSVSAGGFPIITVHPPIVTFVPIDPFLIVTVPDANLAAALRARCGLAATDPIRRGDLYALTGTLNVFGKGIADLEGVQFCRNITSLNASNNPLSSLPDVSGMDALQQLALVVCDFTEVPPVIAGLSDLAVLSMDVNRISEIPEFLAHMPTLRVLSLGTNEIREVPAAFGGSGLTALVVNENRLTSLPEEVISLSSLKNLQIDLNRFTTLPASFGAKSWHTLDVEFNFLDVSPGSSLDTMLSSIVAASCTYQRQLVPIRDLAAETTETSIRIGWTPCPDVTAPSCSETVARYLVYRSDGGVLTELALLGPGTTTYFEDGLAPGTARTYVVGVEYHVVTAFEDGITRHYATLATSTRSLPATATPAAGTTPGLTPVLTPGATEPATPGAPTPTQDATPTPGDGKDGGRSWLSLVPVWVWAVAGGLLLIVFAGAAFVAARIVRARSKRP